MSKEEVIIFENLSVEYKVPLEPITSFKEYLIKYFQRKLSLKVVPAIKELNLKIKKGDIVGIIGPNGAGKSSLLKVIARIIPPTKGRVIVKGRVAPLLELGAGFHPELTGRENIYLNSFILGHTRKEVQQKFEEIVDFAGLGDFIEAPLRTYSSGMRMRLAFAVATAWEPDILLLDEIFAVGDEAFQKKCLDRIKFFQKNETTTLIVSHNMAQIINNCHYTVWLENGMIREIGPSEQVVKAYLNNYF